MPQLHDREITCIFFASIHSSRFLNFVCVCVSVYLRMTVVLITGMNSTQHWKRFAWKLISLMLIKQSRSRGMAGRRQVVLPTGLLFECWQQCGRKDERYFPSVLGDSLQEMGNFLLCLVNQGCLLTHMVAIWFSLV